ncbi:Disease resistance protein [Melia azedarach]|uniref:Disease resistance protein n=1 Tax=Melia azedarach TaxID=155640 RepID=A0ACC1Y437_MELAZ|nr:Disease resistance protein [Melia azedarach]
MAEALVSLVMEQLTSILSEQTEAGVGLVMGIDREIQTLTDNFQAIRAVLEDAENRQVKENAVRDWLDKLKDVSYDIDDVLDEWNIAIRRLQLENEKASKDKRKEVCFFIPSYFFSPRQVLIRHDIAIKIKHLNQTLDHIAKGKNMFNFSSMMGSREVERSWTTSFTDEPEVYGRDQDKNMILNLLLSESSQGLISIPIISVVGMGGVGKTTLAQLVFNDDKVNAHFDIKIWVCVSNPFDEIRIAKAILESLKGEAPNLFELQNVLQHIHQCVKGKKFLLVLDDVWTEDPNSWKQLKGSLKAGSPQSRILVTTRKENVANIIGTTNLIPLGILSEEESWSLFSQVAFSGRTNEECKNLENIGMKVVHESKGLPLAIKTSASLLRSERNIKERQRVSDSGLLELEEIEKRLFPPLLLSYYDLSSILRKCFLYCAIFPKDENIEKDKLIKLWMAQGYLNVERENMELIGEKYFEDLVMRSFFQDFKRSESDGSISCKMHDIVHNFAQFASKNECCIVEDNGPKECGFCSKKTRHLMVIRKPLIPFTSCNNLKKLRSLFVEDALYREDVSNLSKLFDQMACLRTLEFGENSIQRLPREIKKLIHLRYLNLSKNDMIKELPETLCDLHNLQTLDVSYCTNLQKLPEGIGKLLNLRHLINDDTFNVSYMPKGMERLTCLRTLRKFVVSGSRNSYKACSLGCLKNLDLLQGSLFLRRLGNVTDIGEAKQAELKNKKNLLSLRLWFHKLEAKGMMNSDNEVVLEALQPPPSLELLYIFGYEGKTMSPKWLLCLTNLQMLELDGCVKCERLPSLGKLSSLKSLVINDMINLRKVGNEFLGLEIGGRSFSASFIAFPRLKYLEFVLMSNWEEWDYQIVGGGDFNIMPSLCHLKIRTCPKLKALPENLLQMTTLRTLEIGWCPLLGNSLQKETLRISHIPDVEIYPDSGPSDDDSESSTSSVAVDFAIENYQHGAF